MDYTELLESAVAFSSDGIGAQLLKAAEFLYGILYPSNAGPAVPASEVDAAAAIQAVFAAL
ncbi:MAG TPA: hypothetical protein VK089_01470 [Corynebacterium sp.]|nr:hypothetical protein [Corynebacterium sp.]